MGTLCTRNKPNDGMNERIYGHVTKKNANNKRGRNKNPPER